MKFCNNCAVPESQKCDAVSCPPACNGAEDACPCFNTGCFKAGNDLFSYLKMFLVQQNEDLLKRYDL